MHEKHPIEEKSFQIMGERYDLSQFDDKALPIAQRVLHATADIELVKSMLIDIEAVDKITDAIGSDMPLVCDVEMVRSAIAYKNTVCGLSQARNSRTIAPGNTLSQIAIELATHDLPPGFIAVIGCAPTALFRLLDLIDSNQILPAAIIGMPVGFVGALESKLRLAKCSIAHITNSSERGGSAAAAAAFNAIYRLANSPQN